MVARILLKVPGQGMLSGGQPDGCLFRAGSLWNHFGKRTRASSVMGDNKRSPERILRRP
ncbi:hypothetical protein ACSYAY_00180 [Leptospirillum ferriphilum]|uniref:Uncharacterized protein n=1 Tax=Leptospirillum ferriphilum TaxID=178606 RepID=A0A094YM22_9BACT|nr:hypothetical protein LptCag_1054 [Leptospirillum ferriphilum]